MLKINTSRRGHDAYCECGEGFHRPPGSQKRRCPECTYAENKRVERGRRKARRQEACGKASPRKPSLSPFADVGFCPSDEELIRRRRCLLVEEPISE